MESERSRSERKPTHLCATPFCRNDHVPGRRLCHKCKNRRWREANPISYLYDNLRWHARSRGKGFELTLQEFTDFCLRTNYHERKGQQKNSLTVDRIRSWLPYRADNIQAITHLENSTKQDNPPDENPF